ncbi:hypothetical protein HELRODRAFT_165318 [Helobdella robusta]|uniref:Uncharacterized protein n=1 Tax=Helobdella robusta TaxID=6412 RepID=T1EWL1_HELRO|nr:hypothetical protein HELRODRAFT_165318 [Helobdella robusta]ESN91308.1 hypothetical protein HELRODRAFT_165318 [Helobdella robusta]
MLKIAQSPEIYETTATPDPEEGEGGEEEMSPETSSDANHLSALNQQSKQSSLENGGDSGAWESALIDKPWSTPALEENLPIQISLTSAHNNSYQNNSLLDTDLENDDRSAIFFVRKSPSTPMSTPRSSVRSTTTPRVSAPVSRTGQLYRNSSSTNCSELMMNDEQVYDLTDKHRCFAIGNKKKPDVITGNSFDAYRNYHRFRNSRCRCCFHQRIEILVNPEEIVIEIGKIPIYWYIL